MKNTNQFIEINKLDTAKLHPIEMEGYKNQLYLYFDEEKIKDFNYASDAEKISFKKIVDCPSFCRKESEEGIKRISSNPPKCKIDLNGNIIKTIFKYELKVKGTNKEGRIALYELKTNDEGRTTLLIAGQYFAKGLHKIKDLNKGYSCSFFYKKPNAPQTRRAETARHELMSPQGKYAK